MGGEFRTKGANIALGPVVGPLGRVVMSGRNWEGISVDPYLSGALAAETVSGIQSVGVITSTKVGAAAEHKHNPDACTSSVNMSSTSLATSKKPTEIRKEMLLRYLPTLMTGQYTSFTSGTSAAPSRRRTRH
jgi:beta-glucosidase-like glycosyl hydrolase